MINKNIPLLLAATLLFAHTESARAIDVSHCASVASEYICKHPIIASATALSVICLGFIGKKIKEIVCREKQHQEDVKVVPVDTAYQKQEACADLPNAQTSKIISEQGADNESTAIQQVPEASEHIQPISQPTTQKTIVTVEMTSFHGNTPGHMMFICSNQACKVF